MDFYNEKLHIDNYTLPFKQNGISGRNVQMNRILDINQTCHGQNLPLIDVLNRQLEYIGQFLLDTGSEGNLIKISSLPFDCGINITEKIFPKGVSGKIVSTLATTEISIFGYPTKFQIVTEDFPIPCEGLLGAEYFENSHAILDFEHQCIRVGGKCSIFK